MSKSAYINSRIEPKLKAKAERVLKEIGVSPSQAITMLYSQIVARRGLPFSAQVPLSQRTPNAKTLAAFREIEAGGGEVFTGSTEEAFAAMLRSRHASRDLKIVKAIQGGMTLVEAAEKFGISKQRVHQIVKAAS